MKRIPQCLLLAFQVFVVASTGLFAQEKEITMSEFWDYMRWSQAETKELPFRRTVTIELSDFPDRAWEPYSSWIVENVFPNRSRQVYTSKIQRTVIHIGDEIYSKESDEKWIRAKSEKEYRVNQPAALFGHAKSRITVTSQAESNGKGVMLIRAVSKSWHVKEPNKQLKVNDYWYDEKGVLVRIESIGYTGEQWRREIQIIEYDPKDLKIEAPKMN